MDESKILDKPIKIGSKTSKNRFCIQPMESGDATLEGLPSKYTMERYHRYASGGAGIVVIEAVTLQYRSRSTEHQLLLDPENAQNMNFWRRFFRTMKDCYPDTLFIMQLQHAGEFSSDVFSERVCVKPHPAFGGKIINADYADNVIEQTIAAARFLYDAGCDGVDIKFCHGYLGSQILRPYNDREWKYGGSWANRSSFAFNMCEGIRRHIPDRGFLVGAKVSAFEDFEGGQIFEESLDLIRGLEARGADFFIESLGNAYFSWSLMAPGGKDRGNVYKHLAAAKIIKDSLAPETVLIGGGLSALGSQLPVVSEYGIYNGLFDMAGLGRQAFADPSLPAKYAEDRLEEVHWCRCCDKCGELLRSGRQSYCVFV